VRDQEGAYDVMNSKNIRGDYAERGYVDDVIEPQETRAKLIRMLHVLRTKEDTNPWKKHGNIPL
jgi:acetyl-CoA carboxylase carboxyltransferase component